MSDVKLDSNLPPDPFTPWITRTSGLGAAIAALLGSIVPGLGDTGKMIAYSLAAVLTLAAATLYYLGRRKLSRTPVTDAPDVSGTLLRGLLPFEEGDSLFGRDGETKDIMTIIRSADFRFGVVWGPSGCGKTSFIRAKVLAAARARDMHPVYLARPSADPAQAIEKKLQALNTIEARDGSRGAASEAGNRPAGSANGVVVIIDQFEEFFLLHAAKEEMGVFKRSLAALLERTDTKIALIVAIREDYFARLQGLAPEIPDPTSPRTTFELENLRTERAREILERSIEQDDSGFDPALIQRIVADLEQKGFVRPSELQLVATFLKRKGVRTRTEYDAKGGAPGVIASFIKDEIARLPKPIIGQIVLRRLCSPDGDVKSPIDVHISELRQELASKGLSSPADQELVSSCLLQFENAHVVVQPDREVYNLVHDFFAPLIRSATQGVESNAERATRLLNRYISEWKLDRQSRIPGRHLWFIWQHAPRDLLESSSARSLLKRSAGRAAVPVLVPFLVVLIPLVVAYAIGWNSWYLSTQPARYADGASEIVVRAGQPALRFLPGFGQVIEAPGYSMDDLRVGDNSLRNEIPRETIWGFGSRETAILALAERLQPMKQAQLYRCIGKNDKAAEVLQASFKKVRGWSAEEAMRLGLVGRANSGQAPTELEKALYDAALKQTAFPRSEELSSLVALLEIQKFAKPPAGLISLDEMLKLYDRALVPSARGVSGGSAIIEAALEHLLIADAAVVTEAHLAALAAVLRNAQRDTWMRGRGTHLLKTLASFNPALGPTALRNALEIAFGGDASGNTDPGWATIEALTTAEEIARQTPTSVAAPSINLLQHALDRDPLDPESVARAASIAWPFLQANRQALSPNFLGKLRAFFDDKSNDAHARGNAALVLARLGLIDSGWRHEGAITWLFGLLASSPTRTNRLQDLVPRAAAIAGAMAVVEPIQAEQRLSALRQLGFVYRGGGASTATRANFELAHALTNLATGIAVSDEVAEEFIQSAENPAAPSYYDDSANLLIAVARFASAKVLREADRIRQIKTTSIRAYYMREDRGDRLVGALARANYEALRKSAPNRVVQELTASMQKSGDREAQIFGSYGLYFLALDKPEMVEELRTSLFARMKSNMMTERIAAAQALEMLPTAQLINKARKNKDEVGRARAILGIEAQNPEAHIKFAALIGLMEISY